VAIQGGVPGGGIFMNEREAERGMIKKHPKIKRTSREVMEGRIVAEAEREYRPLKLRTRAYSAICMALGGENLL